MGNFLTFCLVILFKIVHTATLGYDRKLYFRLHTDANLSKASFFSNTQ